MSNPFLSQLENKFHERMKMHSDCETSIVEIHCIHIGRLYLKLQSEELLSIELLSIVKNSQVYESVFSFQILIFDQETH